MFNSCCDPEDVATKGTDTQEGDRQQSRGVNIKPAAVAPEPQKKNSNSAAKPCIVPAAATTREFKVDTATPNDPPTETETVSVSLEESTKLERILKTDQEDKKKTVPVVRIRRRLETAIFTIVVLFGTSFALQRLGHEADLNFGLSKLSSPIKFGIVTDEVAKPSTDVDPVSVGLKGKEPVAVGEPAAVEEETAQQDEGEPIAVAEAEAAQKDIDAPGDSTEATLD